MEINHPIFSNKNVFDSTIFNIKNKKYIIEKYYNELTDKDLIGIIIIDVKNLKYIDFLAYSNTVNEEYFNNHIHLWNASWQQIKDTNNEAIQYYKTLL